METSKLLIVGSNGQLGTALREQYPDAQAVDSAHLNIADPEAVAAYDWSGVETILNAAAYTNVDGAETPEGRVSAWAANASGVRNLAAAAVQHSLTLFHISSEYVFDGTAEQPHLETEGFSPLSVYGSSKVGGDLAASVVPQHYVLRTTWVIGEGKNFVRTMLSLGERGIAPTVVADQVGRLTFTSELVRIIDHFLQTKPAYGTYNATNGGEPASWADITREIFKLGNYDLTVTDTTTPEYFASKPESAPRPLNCKLDLSKIEATGFKPSDWRDGLAAYVKKETSKS